MVDVLSVSPMDPKFFQKKNWDLIDATGDLKKKSPG